MESQVAGRTFRLEIGMCVGGLQSVIQKHFEQHQNKHRVPLIILVQRDNGKHWAPKRFYMLGLWPFVTPSCDTTWPFGHLSTRSFFRNPWSPPQEVHEKKRDAMVHAREMKYPACSTWSWDDVWSVEQMLSAVFSIITHVHACFDPKIDRSLVRWKDRDQNIIYTLIIIYLLYIIYIYIYIYIYIPYICSIYPLVN